MGAQGLQFKKLHGVTLQIICQGIPNSPHIVGHINVFRAHNDSRDEH